MGGAKFATKNENESAGFNLDWDVTDRLGFALDFHDSSAESGSDSPYGSNAVLGCGRLLSAAPRRAISAPTFRS